MSSDSPLATSNVPLPLFLPSPSHPYPGMLMWRTIFFSRVSLTHPPLCDNAVCSMETPATKVTMMANNIMARFKNMEIAPAALKRARASPSRAAPAQAPAQMQAVQLPALPMALPATATASADAAKAEMAAELVRLRAEVAAIKASHAALKADHDKVEWMMDMCTVCQDPLYEGVSVVKLECKHAMHTTCFDMMAENKLKDLQMMRPRGRAEGVGGSISALVMNCNVCRTRITSNLDIGVCTAKHVIEQTEMLAAKAVATSCKRLTSVPTEIKNYCKSIKANPEAVFDQATYKVFICGSADCKNPYVDVSHAGCNGVESFECYTCASTTTWAKHVHGVQCDNCEVAFERTHGCSHMTCKNCKYQFCYVCGGEYTGYQVMRTGASMVWSIPFCERPQPGAVNLQGNPMRYGKCLCLVRNAIENAASVRRADMQTMCLALPGLGYMKGYGFEKLTPSVSDEPIELE